MKLLTLVPAILTLSLGACFQDTRTADFRLGQGDQKSILVFFSEKSTPNERSMFITNVLSRKQSAMSGHRHKAGIELIRSIRSGKHFGVGVRFFEDASYDDIEAVEKSIKAARASYNIVKVFKDRDERSVTEDEFNVDNMN